MFEEIFIKRIMDLIVDKGLSSLTYIDYITFKEIVTKRRLIQTDLERELNIEKLIKIKKNLSNMSIN